MSVAILFSGAPRSLDTTHQNIRDTFDRAFDNYSIFAHVPECDTSWQVSEYFPEATVVVEPDSIIPDSAFKNAKFKTGTQAYLQQLLGWQKVYNLALTGQNHFQMMVRCRMDILFTTEIPHLTDLRPDVMYIPDFHHHGGVNDRFCISGCELMANYCSSFQIAMREPYKCTHAETFLSYCLAAQETPVQFVNVKFDRVRQSGVRIDDTNCNKGGARSYPAPLIREDMS